MTDPAQPLLAKRYRYSKALRRSKDSCLWLAVDQLTGQTVVALARRSVSVEPLVALTEVRHPNLASVLDVLLDVDPAALPPGTAIPTPGVAIAEYVPGATVSDQLARGVMRPVDAALTFATVASALTAIHDADAVHGAVGCNSIVLESAGAARAPILTQLVARPSVSGCSPERAAGQGRCAGDDVWALHVALFVALTGAAPYTGATVQRVAENVSAGKLRDLREFGLRDQDLQGLLEKGLLIDPLLRRREADSLYIALSRWAQGRSSMADAVQRMAENQRTTVPAPPLVLCGPQADASGRGETAQAAPPAEHRKRFRSAPTLREDEIDTKIMAASDLPRYLRPGSREAKEPRRPLARTREHVRRLHGTARRVPRRKAESVDVELELELELELEPASAPPPPAPPIHASVPDSSARSRPGPRVVPALPAQAPMPAAPRTAAPPAPGRRRAVLGALGSLLVLSLLGIAVGAVALVAPHRVASVVPDLVWFRHLPSIASAAPAPAASPIATPAPSAPPSASPVPLPRVQPVASPLRLASLASSAAASAPTPDGSAPSPAAAASSSATGQSSEPPDAEAVRSCVATFFDKNTFNAGVGTDFRFLCDDLDLTQTNAEILHTLVAHSLGKVTAGMRTWSTLGWYELAATAMMRGRCCGPGAARIHAPTGGTPCNDGVEVALRKLADTSPTTDSAGLLAQSYEQSVNCYYAHGVPRPFRYRQPPSSYDREQFVRFVQHAVAKGMR